jgi:predicted nucleic acid-binding Zn ribbon protein
MKPGRPQPIAEILSDLMVRRGYARQEASAAAVEAWRAAAGPLLAEHTCVARCRRGVLEVLVANSTLVQEITFRKAGLIKDLARLLPEEQITDLKLRVGRVK